MEKSKKIREKKGFKTTSKPTVCKKTSKVKKTKEELLKLPLKVSIPSEGVTVKDLSKKLSMGVRDLISNLKKFGVKAKSTDKLDYDTSVLISHELGYEVELPVQQVTQQIEIPEEKTVQQVMVEEPKVVVEPKIERLKPRAPVITVMGHIDHGKTTLLDAIRETRVAEKEFGGITQHIGAYKVKLDGGKEIVFIDTPGHEAFTAMRARGAQITDIVLLVVDSVDGVMPQTIEAINHARAAGVPIIVALNKIDLPNANPEKVKSDLANKFGLVPEEWGGETLYQEVSARKRINIKELLELISLKAEVMELKTIYDCPAEGTIIESKLDPRRGIVGTLLLQKGRLKIGDVFIVGYSSGKVKAMFDDMGNKLDVSIPVTPIEILGFNALPDVGEKLIVVKDEKEAEELIERRKQIKMSKQVTRPESVKDLVEVSQRKEIKSLNLLIRVDVQGSLEAIINSISRFNRDDIKINVVHSGIGCVTESDVELAYLTGARIIAFNVKSDPKAIELAKERNVDIRIHRVIFELLDETKSLIDGLIPPKYIETIIGVAEIKQIFKISKVGNVAGCYVSKGKIQLNSKARLIRDGSIVYDGSIASLRRFKTDVNEVDAGFECGVALRNFQDIKVGDIIETYEVRIEK